MKRKLKGFIIAFLLIPTVSFAAFYLFVSLYYTDGFTFNTRINGVYCTGKSIEEVNKELVKTTTPEKMLIKCDELGTEEEILLSDIEYYLDYTKGLKAIFGKQNPFMWIFNASKSSPTNNVKPDIHFNEDKLRNCINKLKVIKEHDESAPFECKLKYSKDTGYYLYENIGKTIDADMVFELAKLSVTDSLTVDITDNCFYAREESADMLFNRFLWSEIEDYLTTKIYYDMGDDVIPIDAPVLSTFILFDESEEDFIRNSDGSLFISEASISKYVDDLCDKYDTYEMPRKFVTHLGEVKDIKTSIYGTLIDRDAEKEYLINAIKSYEEDYHIPKYKKEPYHRGLNDIGDTYIEVDLTRQMLYYIENGEEKMVCDVVTGKPSAGRATPEVLCYVYKKVPGKYLRGEDYCSWVDYWMPIYNNIGLHDATWQSKFGGDRYLSHGSRGCINMRREDAKALYESIEVGIPVIVYK